MQNLRRFPGTIILIALLAAAVILLLHISASSASHDALTFQESPQKPIGQTGSWDLIFQDEFNGQALDTHKWTTCYWWDNRGCTNEGNKNLNWYQPENVSIADGELKLTARRQRVQASDGRSYDYTSGMVTTGRNVSDTSDPARFAFQYGYVEVRARVPKGQGLWPALWLLPTNHTSKPEIDIMEVLGHEPDRLHMTIHYLHANGQRGRDKRIFRGRDLSADWHTYAIHWTAENITWYIDGREQFRYTKEAVIPTEPMYLLMNLAVGGEWPGAPNKETPFPSQFAIDYVRIWKQGSDVSLYPTSMTYTAIPAKNQKSQENAGRSLNDEAQHVAHLQFDLAQLAGMNITDASIRIRTAEQSTNAATNDRFIYLVEGKLPEDGIITPANLPEMEIRKLASSSRAQLFHDIPLDLSTIQKQDGQTLSLTLIASGYENVYPFSSELSSFRPQLIIQVKPEQTGLWQRLNQRLRATFPF